MQALEVNQKVRLTRGVPELELGRGSVGVMQSVWFSPTPVYDVEFSSDELDGASRALLDSDYIEVAAQLEWVK